MLFRILKKDLKRKRTMNLIIFLFIAIAAMFLASSVTDMSVVLRGVDYYLDKSNVPDYMVLRSVTAEAAKEDAISDWMSNSTLAEDYTVEKSIIIRSDSMMIQRGEEGVAYKQSGASELLVQPQKYGRIFDEDGNLIELGRGEIAVPLIDKNANALKIGDKLSVTVGTIQKEFTVSCFTKDAICGTSYMGFKRLLISKEDYMQLAEQEDNLFNLWYMVRTDQVERFQKSLKAQSFPLVFSFDRATVKLCYMTEMLIAGILLIVSVCLILISFFVLRFTIIFTIQEDYKDIGVMKAIGIKNPGIKSIYLIKYLGLAIAGAVLGFTASFPFAALLVGQVSDNLLMEDTGQNPLVNLGCGIVVVLLVVCFCYTSMKKLDQYSAIEAIRNGSTGERFHGTSMIKLKKHGNLPPAIFIAFNDILTSIRKYAVMMLTFCIGTMLIIIPVNAMNTLKDDSMVTLFGYTQSDFYISQILDTNIICEGGKEKALDIMKHMELQMEQAGIPAKLYAEVFTTLSMHGEDKGDVYTTVTLQNLNGDRFDYNYYEGSNPILENEIALSEVCAKEMKVGIGDFVYAAVDGEEKEFILTGIFQSMSNQGRLARLNNVINMDYKNLTGVGYLQGDFTGADPDQKTAKKILTELYPDHEVKNTEQYVSVALGNIVDQIDSFKNLIVMLVLCIDGLITVLMMKSFVAKETAEIATLKSIGFRNKALRGIHILRIGIIQVISILFGVFISVVLDDYTVGYVFKFMGAKHLPLTIRPLEVYAVYPLLLFVIPVTVAWISSCMVRKISIREMNGEE